MRRQTRPCPPPRGRPIDLDTLLAALPHEQLLSFLRDYARELEEAERQALIARLLPLAARNAPAWGGGRDASDPELLEDIADFLLRAQVQGEGSPAEADALFNRCARLFHAGNLAGARQAYPLLLQPLAEGELYLGQDESADEVLATSLSEAETSYLFALYETTPLEERPEALWRALNDSWMHTFEPPLAMMERVAGRPPSQLEAFLPRWMEHLRDHLPAPRASGRWSLEGRVQGWLREAVGRTRGAEGLEHLARERGDPDAYRDWVAQLGEAGRWKEVPAALEAASRGVAEGFERAAFADALARLNLKGGDARGAQDALLRAWREAPSLPRLLRWLSVGSPGTEAEGRRARSALREAPRSASPLRALLHVLLGEYEEAARLLKRAPAPGDPDLENPEHIAFPALLTAVAGPAPEASATRALWEALDEEVTPTWEDEPFWPPLLPPERAPAIVCPKARALVEAAARRHPARPETRDAVLSSLSATARAHVRAVLERRRRRDYRHAALALLGCAEALARVGRPEEGRELLASTLRAFSRHVAFQREVRTACASSEVARVWRDLGHERQGRP